MASQPPKLKTVTLSGSFTTGPTGGLLPAAPTNRLQDFPLPNDFTPMGERFNFTILAVLASPLGIAVLVIIVEICFCYRWKLKTKRLRKSTESEPYDIPTTSNISSGVVHELSAGPVAELEAENESSVSWSLGISSPQRTDDGRSRTGDARETTGRSSTESGGAFESHEPKTLREQTRPRAPITTKLEREYEDPRAVKRRNN